MEARRPPGRIGVKVEAPAPRGETPPTGIGDIPVAAIQEEEEEATGSGVAAAEAATVGWKAMQRRGAPLSLARRSATGSEALRVS